MVFGISLGTVGVAFGIVIGAFLVGMLWKFGSELLEGDEPSEAASDAADWGSMILLAVGGVLATVIVQSADALGMLTQFLGAHPFAVSNLGAIGLGALSIGGMLSLSKAQYVGIAMSITGAALLASEMGDSDEA